MSLVRFDDLKFFLISSNFSNSVNLRAHQYRLWHFNEVGSC